MLADTSKTNYSGVSTPSTPSLSFFSFSFSLCFIFLIFSAKVSFFFCSSVFSGFPSLAHISDIFFLDSAFLSLVDRGFSRSFFRSMPLLMLSLLVNAIFSSSAADRSDLRTARCAGLSPGSSVKTECLDGVVVGRGSGFSFNPFVYLLKPCLSIYHSTEVPSGRTLVICGYIFSIFFSYFFSCMKKIPAKTSNQNLVLGKH
jgi:hypothetical protein